MLSNALIGFVLVLFVLVCIAIRRLDRAWLHSYNPFVLVAGATILYTLSPWADSGGTEDPHLGDFLIMQTVAVLGMAVGAVIAHLRHPTRELKKMTAVPRFGTHPIIVAQVMGIGFFLLAYEYYLGGLQNIFLFGYREITTAELDSTWRFVTLVVAQYGIPAILLAAFMTGVRKNFFYLVTAIYVLLMLASGTRNFLIMFTGNLMLFSSVVRRRLSYPKLALASTAGLLLLLTVGIYRNFGVEARNDFYSLYRSEGLKVLNPNSQELGTSFSVFRISQSESNWYDWTPGESYWNALLSVVPTFIWPGRPDSVSRKFSAYFAVPGEGLGFSNNLEALLNGGIVLVFVVNALMLYSVIWVYNRYVVEQVTMFGLAFYGNIVFVAFNWNRIDFQTVFKISLIRIALFYAIAAILLKIVDTRLPHPALARRGEAPKARAPRPSLK